MKKRMPKRTTGPTIKRMTKVKRKVLFLVTMTLWRPSIVMITIFIVIKILMTTISTTLTTIIKVITIIKVDPMVGMALKELKAKGPRKAIKRVKLKLRKTRKRMMFQLNWMLELSNRWLTCKPMRKTKELILMHPLTSN